MTCNIIYKFVHINAKLKNIEKNNNKIKFKIKNKKQKKTYMYFCSTLYYHAHYKPHKITLMFIHSIPSLKFKFGWGSMINLQIAQDSNIPTAPPLRELACMPVMASRLVVKVGFPRKWSRDLLRSWALDDSNKLSLITVDKSTHTHKLTPLNAESLLVKWIFNF